MLRWLKQLFSKRPIYASHRGSERAVVSRHNKVCADPPPMHWSPCHPSTMRRFKASMTCPYGHGLTLREHSIGADGEVSPSVVCPTRGCSFHEYVRLDKWSFGEVA